MEEKMTGIFIFPDKDTKINDYDDYIGSIKTEIVKYFGKKHVKVDNENYPLIVINHTSVSQDDLNNIRREIENRCSYSVTFLAIIGTEEDFENKISNESPVGAALLRRKVGDRVKVVAPEGEYYLVVKQIS